MSQKGRTFTLGSALSPTTPDYHQPASPWEVLNQEHPTSIALGGAEPGASNLHHPVLSAIRCRNNHQPASDLRRMLSQQGRTFTLGSVLSPTTSDYHQAVHHLGRC